MARTAGCCAILMIAVLVTSAAHAQSAKETAEVKARVKSLVVRGTEEYSLGRFDSAGRLFLEAYELLATRGLKVKPALLHNAAVAFDQAGDCERSVELYGRYLQVKPNAASSAELKKSLEKARACAPEVSISSEPPGIEVVIDGKPRGKTPLVTHLKTGAHQLLLALEGHRSIEERVEVDGPMTLYHRLQPIRVEPPPPPPVAATPPPAAQLVAAPAPEPDAELMPLVWASAGTGVAVLIASVVLGQRASSEHSIYREELDKGDECECRDLDRLRAAESSGRDFALASNVTLGVGIAGLAAAAVMFFLDDSSAPPPAASGTGLGFTW